MSATRGGIHSKNFPQNFDKNASCTWLIDVDPNYTIKLEFSEFDVPKINNSCDQQYVAVRLKCFPDIFTLQINVNFKSHSNSLIKF